MDLMLLQASGGRSWPHGCLEGTTGRLGRGPHGSTSYKLNAQLSLVMSISVVFQSEIPHSMIILDMTEAHVANTYCTMQSNAECMLDAMTA